MAHIDTWATAAHIRQSLGKLPAKIAELNFDNTEFNDYVKLQRSALMSQGEESTDRLINLFETLGSVPNPSFQTYAEQIRDDYHENDEKVIADYLMNGCKIKCKNLQQNGNYNVLSKEEEKVIVLLARVDRMKIASTTLQAVTMISSA